jgi:hypothetical protein
MGRLMTQHGNIINMARLQEALDDRQRVNDVHAAFQQILQVPAL